MWSDFKGLLDDVAVAGAFGGLVKWVRLKEGWRDGLMSVVTGAIIARYLHPMASYVLDPLLSTVIVDDASRKALAGFAIGVLGIAVIGFVVDLVKSRFTSVATKDDAK